MALDTTHDTRKVSELVDLYSRGRLNLEPAFQRRSVWRPRQRALLIQSLMDGVPVPSIYLYHRIGRGGRPVYDVIDGKQRLETILLFLNRGPLAGYEDELWVRRSEPEDAPIDWWGWRHLSRAAKNRFYGSVIPTIEVKGAFNEIVDLFVRINSTGTSLSSQEKRHANYYTNPTLKLAQALAEQYSGWLVRQRVLTEAQVQRMKHVELVLELVLGTACGAHLNKKAKIDEIIRGDALSARDLDRAKKAFKQTLNLVTAILPDLKETRFRRLADFYSLTMLVHFYRSEGRSITAHDGARNALARELLVDFGRGVDEVSEARRELKGVSTEQEPFRNYLVTVLQSTDTAVQRRAREKILRDVLDGVFEDLDPKRAFNPVQRRIIWHAAGKKRRCRLCGKPVERWEDASVDHIRAYIKRGRTSLANAQLAHKSCNSKKGARTR